MRRIVTWLLGGLPFDPRSRRALDETLLDWAHEENGAAAGWPRCIAAVTGALAVFRAVVVSSGREAIHVPVWWLAKRMVVFAVIPATFVALPFILPMVGTISYSRIAALLALTVPGILPSVVPLALLLCLMWRTNSPTVPPAGAALVAAIVMLVFTGWILPWLEVTFRDFYMDAIEDAYGVRLRARLTAEPGLISLTASLPNPAMHGVALAALARTTGLAALTASSVLLAEGLLRRIRMRKLGWIAAVPMAYLLVGGAVSAVAQMAPGTLGGVAAVWLKAGVMLAIAAAIQRKTDREVLAPSS